MYSLHSIFKSLKISDRYKVSYVFKRKRPYMPRRDSRISARGGRHGIDDMGVGAYLFGEGYPSPMFQSGVKSFTNVSARKMILHQ